MGRKIYETTPTVKHVDLHVKEYNLTVNKRSLSKINQLKKIFEPKQEEKRSLIFVTLDRSIKKVV